MPSKLNDESRISLLKAEQAILTKYRSNWNIEDKLQFPPLSVD
jgi:hypothetical protein